MKNLLILFVALISAQTFAADGFTNETSVGIILTSGNTKTQSIALKEQLGYNWEANALLFKGSFLRSSANSIENAKSWSLGLRYDRTLNDWLKGFVGQSVSADVYAGLESGYNTDAGAQFALIKSENYNLNGEVGYRFSAWNYNNNTSSNNHFARVALNSTKKINESVSTAAAIEYLPNFTTSEAWLLNGELSLKATLTDIFSLKTAYEVKYFNTPLPGATFNTDTVFSTALVAKF